MTKTQLIAKIAKEKGYTQKVTKDIVDCLFEELKTSLVNGDDVRIVKFATFTTRQRKARDSFSPRDREKVIHIPNRTVPVVRFGQGVKDLVKNTGNV